MTAIGANAFKNCKKLTSFNTGASVSTIGANAFSGCVSMKSFIVGKNVEGIGANAFKSAKKLTSLTIKSKKLTKKKVRNSLKGSSVKTIKVSVDNKNINEKYVKKYRKIFAKSNCGKSVTLA